MYINIVGTGTAIASISPVTIVNNTGQATVSVPSPGSLGVGTYTGVITVSACTSDSSCTSANLSGSPKTINATSAASLDYTINNTPSAVDLVRHSTITGVPAQNWTATTNADWLTVTPSGGSAATMTASLAQDMVNGLTNGTYTGAVTLVPGTAGQPIVLPVSLTIRRTQINYVSPYVAHSGTSDNVIIRGEEFSQVAIQNVLFGSTPAQSFTVVSPTEIHAVYPAFIPRGRHTVRLQSNFTDVRQLADLVVVDTPTFSAAALAYPDIQDKTVSALIYDAERAALGVSVWYQFTGATALIHFTSVANAWQLPTSKPLVNHSGLALSADGTEWIAGMDKSVVHIRADDLTTAATVTSPLFSSGQQNLTEFAVANDGTVAMFGDVSFNCGATLTL